MWFQRNGVPVPNEVLVIALDENTGAIEINGRREQVYTASELDRLNKIRDRRRKREKQKTARIAAYQDDPQHIAFLNRHTQLIVEAKKFTALTYNKTVVDSLAKFNHSGYLTNEEVTELKAAMAAANQAQEHIPPVSVRIEPAPAATQIVNTWLGRVGQTIEVRVKVVHAVGIRRWWRRQHVTVMEDPHGNTLVTQGRFLAKKGAELVIQGEVSGHEDDSQTVLTSVKVRRH